MKPLSSLFSIFLIGLSIVFPLAQSLHPAQATDPHVIQSPLTVLEGSRGTIYQDYLNLTVPGIPPDKVHFTLTRVPAHGFLELQGAGLSVGGGFSQADVNSGDLAYRHDGGETLTDNFGYAVEADWSGLRNLGRSSDTTSQLSTDYDDAALSLDGMWAAFSSSSAELAPGKTTAFYDIFLTNVQTGQIIRIAQGIAGQQPNGDSHYPYLSADGRFMLFTSWANNLVSEDNNPWGDVFLYDRQTGLTGLITGEADGKPAGGHGFGISADGSRLLYLGRDASQNFRLFVKDLQSAATLMVTPNAYVLQAETVNWASLSADGKFIAFDSSQADLVPGDTNATRDIFVYEVETGITERINLKPDGSQMLFAAGLDPSISADGRYTAFIETADGLVPGDENGHYDVYVFDRLTHQTELADMNDQGELANSVAQNPRISPNGRYVTFYSDATNLDSAATRQSFGWIFTHDRQTGHTWLASIPDDGRATSEIVSDAVVDNLGHTLFLSQTYDGAHDLPGQNGYYLNSTNGAPEPVHLVGSFDVRIAPVDDLPTPGMPAPVQAGRGGLTQLTPAQVHASDPDSPPEQIVYTLTGVPAHGALYKNGARLALGDFFTQADVDGGNVSYYNDGSQNASDGLELVLTNIGPVMEYVSKANDGTPANAMSAHGLSISANSRFVAFSSSASLVPGDNNASYDVFVRDLLTQTIERVSVGMNGGEANGHSGLPAISADGRWVAFCSEASNLVAGDTNGYLDYFTFDRLTGNTRRVSIGADGEQVNIAPEYPTAPSISADGRFVAFTSKASSLAPNDTNGVEDIFVFDQQTGKIELISAAPNGSAGDAWSMDPSLSADGRFVAFESHASNLVSGSSSTQADVFLFDRSTRQMERLNLNPDGLQSEFAPVITSDGRSIGFWSNLARLIPPDYPEVSEGLFIYDRSTHQIKLVGPVSSTVYGYSLSADARYAALYDTDTYETNRVNVVDTLTEQTWKASTNVAGQSCQFVYDSLGISSNAALTAFFCSSMKLPPDPKTLVGVFAYRGTGPNLHLNVQVDLSWATIYLPAVSK